MLYSKYVCYCHELGYVLLGGKARQSGESPCGEAALAMPTVGERTDPSQSFWRLTSSQEIIVDMLVDGNIR